MKFGKKRIMKRVILISILFMGQLEAKDITTLLKEYRTEAELSKITKKESAGLVDIFTREDLETMQAHSLKDVLKTVPFLHLTRTPNNILDFTRPTLGYVPLSAIRLYINDHDMTSSSFGSAMLVWGDMPIEYIDHIEIYKATSSIEFGNEAGIIVIKLYTKHPEREEGGKLRTLADNRGSYETDAYYGHTTSRNISWLAYANKDNIKRKRYYYQGHELNSDKHGYNLYTNIAYSGWRLEGGSYHKTTGSFLGKGRTHTPNGGDLEATHSYLHMTKKTERGYKLQISYDRLDYDRTYLDKKIYAGKAGFVSDYRTFFKDSIFTLIGERHIDTGKNMLLMGAFYKYKAFKNHGRFDNRYTAFANGVNLYSLYLENHYRFSDNEMALFSIKQDFYRYDSQVKSQNEWIARLGYISIIGHWKFKLFLVKTYVPVAFYKQYSSEQIPLPSNPSLDMPETRMATGEISYTKDGHTIECEVGAKQIKDAVVYSPSGFVNNGETMDYQFVSLKYSYKSDPFNKFDIDFFAGHNDHDINISPQYGAIFHAFNTIGKFDIYNEIDYYSNYSYAGLNLHASYDYTAAVKYHITDDLSIGVRGENIFGTGFKQAYRNFPYAISVNDRKFWINLEYLF